MTSDKAMETSVHIAKILRATMAALMRHPLVRANERRHSLQASRLQSRRPMA
jgi:hypothetical protein